MEHWQIIVIGTFGGFFLILLTFRYCFDVLFQRFHASRHENSSTYYTSLKYTSMKKQRLRPDLERFVHEEFESPHHEVVAVVLTNYDKCIGQVSHCPLMLVAARWLGKFWMAWQPRCCKKTRLGNTQWPKLYKNYSKSPIRTKTHFERFLDIFDSFFSLIKTN